MKMSLVNLSCKNPKEARGSINIMLEDGDEWLVSGCWFENVDFNIQGEWGYTGKPGEKIRFVGCILKGCTGMDLGENILQSIIDGHRT